MIKKAAIHDLSCHAKLLQSHHHLHPEGEDPREHDRVEQIYHKDSPHRKMPRAEHGCDNEQTASNISVRSFGSKAEPMKQLRSEPGERISIALPSGRPGHNERHTKNATGEPPLSIRWLYMDPQPIVLTSPSFCTTVNERAYIT